jgi:hypothetical protein
VPLLLFVIALNATPVELQDCRVTTPLGGMSDRPAPAQPLVSGVAVTFVNHAAVAATDVTFRVRYDYHTENIDDRGTFTPGVKIQASFKYFVGANYFRDLPDICEIVRVRFADGSTWSLPAPNDTS